MKKLKTLVAMLMVAILVSGCSMKVDFGMKIKANKQISIGAIMAMDDDLIDTMLSMDNLSDNSSSTETKKFSDKERWAYLEKTMKSEENEDVEYEKYQEGKYKGYQLSTPSADIDLVTKSSADSRVNFAKYFEGEANEEPTLFVKDGKYYVSNITFDSSDSESFGQMTDNSSNFEFFEFKFVITLPVKPVSNNADSVSSDGKTLTWDLTKGAKDIDFKFSFDGAKDAKDDNTNPILDNKTNKATDNKKADKDDKKDNTLLYVIGAACGGAVVAGVIVAVALGKKKKA